MDEKRIEGKKAKSRRKIMHAAKYLCESNGIENVTFHDIAKEADVCRTTVFNHFSTTDQLMMALFRQEIEDIDEYCTKISCTGMALIEAVFDKLIEDTAYYPVLTYRIVSSSILREGDQCSALMDIEKMVAENLPEPYSRQQELYTVAVMGAYYGLVNHYHSLNKDFDADQMKKEFHRLLKLIFGGREK